MTSEAIIRSNQIDLILDRSNPFLSHFNKLWDALPVNELYEWDAEHCNGNMEFFYASSDTVFYDTTLVYMKSPGGYLKSFFADIFWSLFHEKFVIDIKESEKILTWLFKYKISNVDNNRHTIIQDHP